VFNLKKDTHGITKQDVLHNFSEEELFQYLLGYYPRLGHYYKSPFRKDSKAGCRFEFKNGALYFVDNAGHNGKVFWDWISLGLELTRVEYHTLLYNIWISNPNKKRFNLLTERTEFQCVIRIQKQEWSEDNYFTRNFHVDPLYLRCEPIFSVRRYWCNTKRNSSLVSNNFGIFKDQIAYYFPDSNHIKLYFPEQEFKWYSNCNDEDIYYFHHLKEYTFENNTLYITKSGKDCMLLHYHLGLPVIAVQQENGYLPDKILKFVIENKLDIILVFDNSEADKPKAYKIQERYKEQIKINLFFYPEDTKDTAEYYSKYGVKNLKQYHNEFWRII
jgi:hypothetical protein